MSKFTDDMLVVTPLTDGKRWMVLEDFSYDIGKLDSGITILVKAGFRMDFASIPKFLFIFPYWAKYNKAPVLHDWLYQCQIGSRKRADEIFLEAMLVEFRHKKLGKFIAYLEYYGVRAFGWIPWNDYKRRR